MDQSVLPENIITTAQFSMENPYEVENRLAFFYYADIDTSGSWAKALLFLSMIAAPEDWSLSEDAETDFHRIEPSHGRQVDAHFKMLDNYIVFTLYKLLSERLNAKSPEDKNAKIYVDDDKLIFDTGLRTSGAYEPIYGYFNRNDHEGHQPWHFFRFFRQSDKKLQDVFPLPEPATYDDLTYQRDWPLRINYDHILSDARHRLRMPTLLQEDSSNYLLKNAFIGAVEFARRQAAQNRDLVVLTYYQNNVQFLLPLSLTEEQPQLALVLLPQENYYYAPTALTMEMAYNDARLISRPAANWLTRGRDGQWTSQL